MANKKKATILTFAVSFLYSIANVVFGLVFTQNIIKFYGSTVNGLISTLTQFVSLFAIIEGGFTTATIVATYEPIFKHDYEKLNNILYTAKRYFNKIGIIITISVLLFGSIYIYFVDSPFTYVQTYTLLIISALNVSMSISGLSRYNILLEGNNQKYILVVFSFLSRFLSWGLSLVFIFAGFNILLVYLTNILNVMINIVLIRSYEARFFKQVTYRGKFDKTLITGTKDVLFQKIANTIFTSTDLIIISVLINLESSSVYNLYYLVFKAISLLLSTAIQAPFNSFGQLFHSEADKNKAFKLFEIFQQFSCIVASILLITTGGMIVPFINVYTSDITDYNYIRPLLAVLFYSQMFVQILNKPCGIILNATGNFHMQNKQCFIAAVVNIICSLTFISVWGINSVVLGSVVGTLVIFIANIIQTYKNVLQRSPFKALFVYFLNYFAGLLIIVVTQKIDFKVNSYIQWVLYAFLFFLVVSILVFLVNLISSKKSTYDTITYIREFVKKKK